MKRIFLIIFVMFAIGANASGFDEVSKSCSAVTTTGACSEFSVNPPDYVHIPPVESFTWQTIISGGTASSVSVTLQGSIDDVTWTTLDTSTSTSGEMRSKTSTAVKFFRCNVGTYSRNGTNLTCNIMPTRTTAGTSSGATACSGLSDAAASCSTDATNASNITSGTLALAQLPAIPESSVTSLVSDLALKAPLASPTFTGTVAGITKSMVGLGSVDNTADTGKPVSTAQQTALDLKANLASPTFTGTVAGITKSMVGLGSADNTSDAGKPVSTAQQTALDLKANLSSPTLVTPTIGVAIATSVNKMAITAPATSSTLAVADGKTLTASNTLTLAGTDSTTQTFPKISANIVGTVSATVGNTDTVSCPSNTTGNFATTYTIPANYLVANKVLRLTLGFNLIATATVPTMAFRLTIGGTPVYAPAGATATAATSGVPILASVLIQGSAVAGPTAAVYTQVSGYMGSTSSVVALFSGTGSAQPVNLATNGTLVIQPQFFCSANTAGNSLTLQQMIVEALN